MESVPFALSVHHFISSVGADAGFASLIGLALLVLLYFAHARETATLRSRADEAGLRVEDLQAQLADLADQVAALPAEISVHAAGARVAAAPVGLQQRVAAGVGAGHSPLPPAAPAGMGAPALAAATRLIPMPEALVEEHQPATVGGGANGSSRVPMGASAGTVQRPAQNDVPARPGGPRPPVGPGRAAGGPSRPNGSQARPAAAQRPGGGQPRAGATGRPMGPARPAPARRRTGRWFLALAVAAGGAAAVVAAVLVLTHKDKAHKPPKPVTSSATRRRTGHTVYVKPTTVTVSVLNGTDQTGLAASVSAKLGTVGFKKGSVTNAANQSQTTSIVGYYSPGYRADALAVAAELKLPTTTVQQVAVGTKTIACSFAPVGCSSQVYVTVGSDLSSQ